uniref:CCR4-NOT transcription complex subunit 7 n=1 Tax=Urocitellus parryii TaxID=9999 RepID=A0A8D2H6B4_UROPR
MPAATVDHSQRICEVWACNLDEEMKKIRQVIRKYNYVAMDTEISLSIGIFLSISCPGNSGILSLLIPLFSTQSFIVEHKKSCGIVVKSKFCVAYNTYHVCSYSCGQTKL